MLVLVLDTIEVVGLNCIGSIDWGFLSRSSGGVDRWSCEYRRYRSLHEGLEVCFRGSV